ncbi:MAG: hypothetical protein PHF00_04150, partial [Elusimicrobia bacterium]|nr:hypothetical protein [Elusimicrobiota bacterium]
MKKPISALVASILVLTAPGLPCYAAISAVVHQGARSGASARALLPARSLLLPGQASDFSAGLFPAGLPAGLGAAALLPTPRPAAPGLAAVSVRTQAVAAPDSEPGPLPLGRLLESRAQLTLGADEVAAMPAGQAKREAASIFDRILGLRPAAAGAEEPVAGTEASVQSVLPAFRGRAAARKPGPPSAPRSEPSLRRARALDAAAGLGRMALAAVSVLGLQAAAAALLPAAFGLVPVAAVWAVSSGALLLPVALYARYRLALRDSPRLAGIKWVLDAAVGAFLGAVVIAAPSLAFVLSAQQLIMAGVPLAALAAPRGRGFGGPMALDSVSLWASLAVLPAFLGAAAAGAIGLGPLLGAAALPVMTTLAFFLGRIIFSAETGRPFSVPGSLQKLRFPSFQWVMIGVVFALLTGFGAVYSNLAFIAWQFFGGKSYGWNREASLPANILGNLLNFNTVYLGLLVFTAVTAFSNPLTFLVLAFAPERAAVWTEALLGKLLPRSEPAPSTKVQPAADPDGAASPARTNHYYRLKTGLLMGGMAATAVLMAFGVFGIASLG